MFDKKSVYNLFFQIQADGINWDVILDNLPITDSEGDLERIQ